MSKKDFDEAVILLQAEECCSRSLSDELDTARTAIAKATELCNRIVEISQRAHISPKFLHVVLEKDKTE